MIKVDNKVIQKEVFGDGTLKCKEVALEREKTYVNITWCYDDDGELFLLWCLARHIREQYPDMKVNLALPYIPNARQDRKTGKHIFTLKYFAEAINGMKFDKVFVLDPHSDVSLALIDRVEEMDLPFQVSPDGATYMFPDAGAAKKYSPRYQQNRNDNPFIIGNAHRDSEGRITEYDLLNFKDHTEKVIIRDDICGYGDTFVAAAKELRKHGVKHITLIVSHCENTIIKGDVLDNIDRIFTTDSICTVEHPKLIVTKRYRS